MAPVIFQHALANCLVGRRLVLLAYGCVHFDALGVSVFLVTLVYFLPCHLRQKFSLDRKSLVAVPCENGLLLCGFKLRVVDEAEFVHAPQNIFLAQLGALGIDHRIIGGGSFGQAGQHGHLGHIDLVKILSEVDLRRCSESIGALAEVYLVDVQLENFVLVQAMLDLEGKQHLIEFARQRFFFG